MSATPRAIVCALGLIASPHALATEARSDSESTAQEDVQTRVVLAAALRDTLLTVRTAEARFEIKEVLADPRLQPLPRQRRDEARPRARAARFLDLDPPRGAPDYLATTLDSGAFLAFGSFWYFVDRATNQKDWRYEINLATLQRKFITFDAIDYDDNALGYNTPGHVMSGVFYYLSGRAHGFDARGAFVVSAATSLAWELSTEYREVLSINDMLFTPLGGAALGEPFFQLSEFFARSRPSFGNRLLAGLLTGPSSVLPWRQERAPVVERLDVRGHPVALWHRVITEGGAAASAAVGSGDTVSARAAFEARLVDVEGWDRPGEAAARWLDRPLSSEVRAQADFSSGALRGYLLEGGSIWTGVYGKRPEVAFLFGPSTSFEHVEVSDPERKDRYGAAALIGVGGDATVFLGEARLRLKASLHPVFAAVHSHAFEEEAIWGPARDLAPKVLQRQGYYYALGGRASLRGALEWRAARLEASLRGLTLTSADFLGAAPASPLQLQDQRLRFTAHLAFDLPGTHLSLKGGVESTAREGVAGTFRSAAQTQRLVLQLGYQL